MRHLMRRAVVDACPQIADRVNALAGCLKPGEGVMRWGWSGGRAASCPSADGCAADGAPKDRQRERQQSACRDETAFQTLRYQYMPHKS
jgi:hypothetical protein